MALNLSGTSGITGAGIGTIGPSGANITGVGTFTQVEIDDKIIHVGDTNTAIRFPAADTITAETGGSERFRIDSSGNIGVDQTTPDSFGKFVVNGTGNIISLTSSSGAGSLAFFEGSTGRFYIKTLNGSDGLSFVDGDNSSERLRITSDGLVGVNVTPTSHNDTTAFQIYDDYNSQGYPRLRLTNQSTGSASSDGFEISLDGSNLHAIVRQRENADIHFYTNNTEKLRIGSSGQLGIGGANYGTSGQVLTSGGSGSAPSWASAAGGIEISHQWRLTSSSSGNQVPLTGWELVDTYGGGGFGTAMSESSGIFTFPSTGWWLISFQLSGYSDNSSQNVIGQIETTTNNSSYTHTSLGQQGIYDFNNSYPSHALVYTQALFDVTDTSTHKCRFSFGAGQGNESVKGSTSYSYTNAIFTRLGDT